MSSTDKVLGVLEVMEGAKSSLSGIPQQIRLFKDSVIKIGRSATNCDFAMVDPSISAVHCVIWVTLFDNESLPIFYLKDVSLNGTLVNEKSCLQDNNVHVLENRDMIQIGNYELKFRTCNSVSDHPKSVEGQGFKRNFEKWRISDCMIGTGTFGHVMIAYKQENDNWRGLYKSYAVKIIKLRPNKLDKEAKILLELNHPNIIKVHDTYCDSKNNFYIFQDLIPGGDLFSYLAKSDCLRSISETESLLIVYQILKALNYLHSNGIVHRDLKLDNILLCSKDTIYPKIVLADFGIAKKLGTKPQTFRMYTIVGTPEYCAPEVGFRSNIARAASNTIESTGYDEKCDLWSLGVITHIMLTGISPFYGNGTESNIIQNTRMGRLNLQAKQWSNVSDSAKEFVTKLIQVDVRKRMNTIESLCHKWISKQNSLLEIIYYKKILNTSSSKVPENQTRYSLNKITHNQKKDHDSFKVLDQISVAGKNKVLKSYKHCR